MFCVKIRGRAKIFVFESDRMKWRMALKLLAFTVPMVTVEAADLDGKARRFTCTGLLARAIQHEADHLNGVLFIDRTDPVQIEPLKPELEKLQKANQRKR